MVKMLYFHCRGGGQGSIPGHGTKIPHAVQINVYTLLYIK